MTIKFEKSTEKTLTDVLGEKEFSRFVKTVEQVEDKKASLEDLDDGMFALTRILIVKSAKPDASLQYLISPNLIALYRYIIKYDLAKNVKVKSGLDFFKRLAEASKEINEKLIKPEIRNDKTLDKTERKNLLDIADRFVKINELHFMTMANRKLPISFDSSEQPEWMKESQIIEPQIRKYLIVVANKMKKDVGL